MILLTLKMTLILFSEEEDDTTDTKGDIDII